MRKEVGDALSKDLGKAVAEAVRRELNPLVLTAGRTAQELASLRADLPAPTLVQTIKTKGAIRVLILANNPPWSCFDPKTKDFKGVDVSSIRRVAGDLGVEAKFIPVPAASDLPAKIGQFDIAVLDSNPTSDAVLRVLKYDLLVSPSFVAATTPLPSQQKT